MIVEPLAIYSIKKYLACSKKRLPWVFQLKIGCRLSLTKENLYESIAYTAIIRSGLFSDCWLLLWETSLLLEHPPYNPDPASSDFFCSEIWRKTSEDVVLQDEHLKETVEDYFETQNEIFLLAAKPFALLCLQGKVDPL